MRFHNVAVGVLFGLTMASQAVASPDCSLPLVLQPLPLRPTALPPLSAELPGGSRQLGSPDGVLAYQSNELQAVDRVLLRLRMEACRSVSRSANPAAGYVPKTKWDNTPYRFSAGGNGKKFTAADFDAWMKANGIHVSTGVAQPASASQSPPADPAQPVK